MKALIHNPYWDSWGGGERYVCRFIKRLLDNGYTVDIDWKDDISREAKNRFGILLGNVKYVKDFSSLNYDLVFWVSDGSLPILFAKKNIIHLQFPFVNINGNSLVNQIKSKFYKFVVNSQFTKVFIDNEFKVNSEVIYPPVDVGIFIPKEKENVILYVGRFSKLTQQKGQETLIDSFLKIKKGWKLILAGGVGVGTDEDWLKKLENKAQKNKVEIIKNPSMKELIELYGKAKIFWSASGYGQNEQTNPLAVEHFGITVVEAMAAGCVPIITNLGGHKEIVQNGINGFLWDTTDQLINITNNLIENPDKIKNLSQMTLEKSKIFSTENFYEKIDSLVGHRNNS